MLKPDLGVTAAEQGEDSLGLVFGAGGAGRREAGAGESFQQSLLKVGNAR